MKGAILNVNGIMVDTDKQEFAAWRQLAMYEYGMGLPGKMADAFKSATREEALDKVLTHFHAQAAPADRQNLLAEQDRFYQQAINELDESSLMPGIERLIVDFYDHYVDIAVNDTDGHAGEIIKQTKLDGYINLVAQPPAGSNPYSALAGQLGTKPADTIAIVTAKTAVDQVKDAGMTAIGVGDAGQLAGADYQVAQVGDLRYQMIEKVWEDREN